MMAFMAFAPFPLRILSTLVLSLFTLPMLGATELTSPDATQAPVCHAPEKPEEPGPATVLLSGYGVQHMAIDTRNPKAQAFFDNGLQLAHAFAHAAAISAFQGAALIDPHCAMCAWGESWSRGPTINYPIDDNGRKAALALAKKAAGLAANASLRDQALIAALVVRYSGDQGDEQFAQAMNVLAQVYPHDSEINVMAADAWLIAGEDSREHQDHAIRLLQGVLQRSPNDVGAIHFYIHATEDRGVGDLALPYASRLHTLAPAASHLVHMPSHTFFWAGQYQLAEVANSEAVDLDQADAVRFNYKRGAWGATYHGHNLAYGEAAAIEAGDGEGAIGFAGQILSQQHDVKANNFWSQSAMAQAYFAYGRFGSKQQLSELPDPSDARPFQRAMWHYVRGEAAARAGDLSGITSEEQAMTFLEADALPFGPSAAASKAMVAIGRLVLEGRRAMLESRFSDAVANYGEAAKLQEDELGGIADPPAFWYPVRRGLAAAYLAAGDAAAAKREAKTVLARFPNEPLTRQILASLSLAEGDVKDAGIETSLKQANWVGAASDTPAALL